MLEQIGQSVSSTPTYLPFPLDRNSASRLDDVAADLVERLLAARRYVYLERLAVGLHAGRRVHRVAEQAVARHREAYHARYYCAWKVNTQVIFEWFSSFFSCVFGTKLLIARWNVKVVTTLFVCLSVCLSVCVCLSLSLSLSLSPSPRKQAIYFR